MNQRFIVVVFILKNSTFCMPNSVTDISELAFNKNIRQILISDNLVIRSENSKGAQYIYLNDGNSLSVGCYLYCPVEKYLVRTTNKRYVSIDGVIYSKNQKKLFAVPHYYRGDLIIPEGTVEIRKEAFWTQGSSIIYKKIQSIHIPASVKIIDSRQMDLLNYLVDRQDFKISISSDSTYFYLKDGKIRRY